MAILGRYVIKAFFPHDLSWHHVFEATSGILNAQLLAGLAALSLLGAGAWWLRRDRGILFLHGYVVLTLLPVLNVTGLSWNVFAERYLYLPSVGSCLLVPLVAQRIWALLPAQRFGGAWLPASIGLVVMLG